MPRFRAKGTLTHDAVADLWKHTLSRIPTVFGQISYLASLRDSNSGVYKHHGLSVAFGRDESIRALRESHESVFQHWTRMSLAERSEDLRAYLRDLEDPEAVVASYWLTSSQAALQVPSSAHPMERELFRQDVETLLKIIRNEAGAGPPH
jgi:hypothetical protein